MIQAHDINKYSLEAKEKIRNELQDLILRTKAGEEWEKFNPNTPEYVRHYFTYPYDRASEIDMYLAKAYGIVEKVSDLTYEVILPTSEKEVIALMELSYGGTLRSPKGLYPRDELQEFLYRYNLFHHLRQACDDFMFSGQGQNHPLRNEGRDIAANYIDDIRNKRRVVYSDMVSKGMALPKWKKEFVAYSIVKNLYSDAIFQYRSAWLGQQSLDIYIPSLKVAIEYQGVQHYEPVDFFGGEEGYSETHERDLIKQTKCAEHDVTLVEWPFNAPLTGEYIKALLSEKLSD